MLSNFNHEQINNSSYVIRASFYSQYLE